MRIFGYHGIGGGQGGWGERWRGVGLVDPEAGCAGQREKGVAVGQGATYVASGG